MTRLSYDINKPWIKATLKEIKNIIKNQNVLVQDPEKGDPVTPCMDVYKAKIQSDVSLEKLKLIIVVRGDLKNKELFGDIWSPTSSMSTFKYISVDSVKYKARVHQLYFIGEFLQEQNKNRVFVKLDSRYANSFPEYSNYFGRALILFNSMYGMTNYGNLFSDYLTECLLKAGFIQYQSQMSIYYKYAAY